jgi:hypothetical protein
VLDMPRLLTSLEPELSARLAAARYDRATTLLVRTDIGDGVLRIDGGTCRAGGDVAARSPNVRVLNLPQMALARLTFGAFEPGETLDQLGTQVTGHVRDLVTILFPRRHQHMYLPDRY